MRFFVSREIVLGKFLTLKILRIFTDLPLSEMELTGPEYRHCGECRHWVHVSNNHCHKCGFCTSKERAYLIRICRGSPRLDFYWAFFGPSVGLFRTLENSILAN